MDVTDLEAVQYGMRIVQRDLHRALKEAGPVEEIVLLPMITVAVDLLDRVDTLIKAIGEDK